MTTTVETPPLGSVGTPQHARPVMPAEAAPPTPPRRRVRTTEQVSRTERIVAYALLIVGALAFLVPFYFVVNASLKSEAEVNAGEFARPVFLAPPAPGEAIPLDRLPAKIRDAANAALAQNDATASITEAFVKTQPAAQQGAPGTQTYILRAKTSAVDRQLQVAADGTVQSNVPLLLGPQWRNYPRALARDKMDFWPALSNTVVITVVCVVGQVISCSLVGFGFARFAFRGRSILFMVMLSTMMLPAQVTMIPVFVLFKTLHMVDTFWPLMIPAWLASPFFVFMFRQFFTQIPEELIEAARIDGASNWRVYWQLMLPLSGPVIAIVSIYTFLAAWNDFVGPLIYLNSPESRTLALALNSFRGQYGQSDAHLLMAAAVVCMLPCVILFFAAQRYFVESVAMTGLKS